MLGRAINTVPKAELIFAEGKQVIMGRKGGESQRKDIKKDKISGGRRSLLPGGVGFPRWGGSWHCSH